MRRLSFLAVILSSSAVATPSLDPTFGDHAVIQRGAPIELRGSAAPGEKLNIRFAGQSRSVRADKSGRWSASFAPLQGGGPFQIEAAGASGTASASDVVIGDVWLCSGQSNMEYPLRRALNGDGEVQNAGDTDLRLLKIPQQLAPTPRVQFVKALSWQPATPDSAKDFSAACYFMTRDFRQSEKVPIGAIDDTWGGTPIRQWMDEAAVRASGGADLVDMVEQARSNPALAMHRFGETWGEWWRSRTGDRPGQEPWLASDRLSWKPVPKLSLWDEWGPEWKTRIGEMWVRRRVTLTAAEAAQAASLSMTALDDLDQTFVNGVTVGGTNDWSTPRDYPLPKGLLKPGENEILVFVRNNYGPGGFNGPAERFKLTFADGHLKPLADAWEYSWIDDQVGAPPTQPWQGVAGVSQIYNAMVAPLGPLRLKGVAWYQGEADVGNAGYDRRLAAWMGNWRTQFRDARLPFLIVGLAGFGKPVPGPAESGWAALINEQRLAVERDPRTALISAIDLGEPNDIHPANKQEVGKRLALAAHTLAYSGGTVGPLPISAQRTGTGVVVKFTKPLQVLSSARPATIELCGATAGTCRYVDARVNADTVEIANDGQPATRVRYAWADYPIANLYDLDLLPAPPFEIPIAP